MLRTALLFTLTLLLFPVAADSHKKLERATQKIIYDGDLFKYSSTTTVVENEETSEKEYSYNPQGDPKYNLIAVNGEKPTKKEIKKFLKEIEEEGSEDDSMDGFLGKSYTKIYDDGKVAKFTYTTKESFMPKKDYYLDGEITIDLVKEEVVSILLVNPKEYSIMGAKLKKMVMEFYFESFNQEYMVLSSMNFNMNGKFLMKEFTQSSTTEIYNYEMVN